MTQSPLHIHLCVIQPPGHVHGLIFLDAARYFRQQFRRLGVQVSLAKNRLREDAVNIVFGAHQGFAPGWRQRHACMFVNLELLGEGGSRVSAAYLQLLKTSAVIDYDPANVPAYSARPEEVPIIRFGYAAYLDDGQTLPLSQRPIDLLFMGSVSERRARWLRKIEACGRSVTLFDGPVFGPERDAYIQQSKAVLNCHYCEGTSFEQVRAFKCLSLGTPVISERHPGAMVPDGYEDSVLWITEDNLEDFFQNVFGTPAFEAMAQRSLANFRAPDALHDPLEVYAEVLDFARGYAQGHAMHKPPGPFEPSRIVLGCGPDYRPEALNLDLDERHEPDLALALESAPPLPWLMSTKWGAQLQVQAGSVHKLETRNALHQSRDPALWMKRCLELLAENGVLEVEAPIHHAASAWQIPQTQRAFHPNFWLYFTDWFWSQGWFEHRFHLESIQGLDLQGQPVPMEAASLMKVQLRKIPTTLAERMLARTQQQDFGGIPSDDWSTELDQSVDKSVDQCVRMEPSDCPLPARAGG